MFKTLPKLSFNCYGILDWGIFLCRLWNAIFDTLMSIECLKNDAKVREFENINKRSFGSIEDFVVPFEQLLGLCSSLSGDQFLFLLVLDRVDTNNSSFPISNFVDKVRMTFIFVIVLAINWLLIFTSYIYFTDLLRFVENCYRRSHSHHRQCYDIKFSTIR